MITQWSIDTLGNLVAQLLLLVPPLPPVLQTALTMLQNGGAYLAGEVAKFGIIAPWEAITVYLALWIAALGFWGTSLLIRVVLWALGR